MENSQERAFRCLGGTLCVGLLVSFSLMPLASVRHLRLNAEAAAVCVPPCVAHGRRHLYSQHTPKNETRSATRAANTLTKKNDSVIRRIFALLSLGDVHGISLIGIKSLPSFLPPPLCSRTGCLFFCWPCCRFDVTAPPLLSLSFITECCAATKPEKKKSGRDFGFPYRCGGVYTHVNTGRRRRKKKRNGNQTNCF
jgi:hypothetical protein